MYSSKYYNNMFSRWMTWAVQIIVFGDRMGNFWAYKKKKEKMHCPTKDYLDHNDLLLTDFYVAML